MIVFEPVQLTDLLGYVGVLTAVGSGIWQYRSSSMRDFIKPLREAQLRLYEDATSTASMLATLPRNSKQWKERHSHFLHLYFGPLAIFEDFERRPAIEARQSGTQPAERKLTVEQAMIDFKRCLHRGTDDKMLTGLSLALAHACRESLGRSWNVRVEHLTGKYNEIHGPAAPNVALPSNKG